MAVTLATKVIALLEREKRTRVSRDELVGFFAASRSGFRSLPAYASDVLSPEGKARHEVKGWTVPQSELGRTGRKPDISVRNSLAAWIRDRLLPAIVECGGPALTMDQVAIHLEGFGDDVRIVIYRKF